MKRTMLWGALFTLICTQVQAEVTQPPTQTQTPGSAATPVTNPPTSPTPVTTQPAPNGQPSQGVQPAQPQLQGQPAPVQPTQVQNPQQAQPQPAPVINCEYKIPATTKHIDQSLVSSWSEKAVVQAFDFDPASVDTQMQKLKACFTEQGWTGFNSALEKSGNLEAIKTQKLTVSSQVDGQLQFTETKDNQWKIILPLQVVYQNDKEKVTQLLNVNLTVGRKLSGDLGITQMIATPRMPNTAQQPGGVTPNATAPANAAPGTPTASPQQPSTTANPGTPH